MKINKFIIRIGFIIVFAFLFSSPSYAQLSSQQIKDIRKITVRVQSGNKIGTGFLWNNKKWIVTTLHLIEDKNNIEITLSNQVQGAKLIKVLAKYDLALLELDSPTSLLPFSVINSSPTLNSNLYTMGYNGKGNVNSIIDRSLRLGFNSSGKLKGLLPKKIKDVLDQCESPSPEIEILYFDGSLIPGFSGSPIVDNSGKLVGVADGGLEDGTVSISWGIGAHKLQALATSNESLPSSLICDGANNVKFASENLLEEDELTYVEFGDFQFIKTKTRSLYDIIYTIDDPAGLEQLISAYEMNNPSIDYLNFRYDIYEDFGTGATICVPEGLKLSVEQGFIAGGYPDYDLAYLAWPANVISNQFNPLVKYNPYSVSFENKIIQLIGGNYGYEKDFNWSYAQPVITENGMAVNRTGYTVFSTQIQNFIQVNVPEKYLFTTHIAQDDTYIGMTAINVDVTNQTTQNTINCLNSGACNNQGTSAICQKLCTKFELVARMVIGVHIGGFSNAYDD